MGGEAGSTNQLALFNPICYLNECQILPNNFCQSNNVPKIRWLAGSLFHVFFFNYKVGIFHLLFPTQIHTYTPFLLALLCILLFESVFCHRNSVFSCHLHLFPTTFSDYASTHSIWIFALQLMPPEEVARFGSLLHS